MSSAGSHQAVEPRMALLSVAEPILASCRASTLGVCPTLSSLGLSCGALHPLGPSCTALCLVPVADCVLGPDPPIDPVSCPGPACCPGPASVSDVPRYQLLGLL